MSGTIFKSDNIKGKKCHEVTAQTVQLNNLVIVTFILDHNKLCSKWPYLIMRADVIY